MPDAPSLLQLQRTPRPVAPLQRLRQHLALTPGELIRGGRRGTMGCGNQMGAVVAGVEQGIGDLSCFAAVVDAAVAVKKLGNSRWASQTERLGDTVLLVDCLAVHACAYGSGKKLGSGCWEWTGYWTAFEEESAKLEKRFAEGPVLQPVTPALVLKASDLYVSCLQVVQVQHCTCRKQQSCVQRKLQQVAQTRTKP